MIKETIMFISIIMRLKSDGSATSLRWKFVVSLSFSEKQMEKQTNKKKQKLRANSDTPAKFFPNYYSTILYYSAP